MRRIIALVCPPLCVLALAGCADLPWHRAAKGQAQTQTQVAQGPLGPIAAAPPAALDRSTAAERQAALSSAGPGGRPLGKTVASLGDPTRPGFWLRTPLVKRPQQGRVTVQARSLKVELLPGSGPQGGGSQLSLAAFRALGIGLTDLPQLTVYGP